MPLAEAAPRISCKRSPSLAHRDRCRLGFGPPVSMRGPGSIDDRDRSFRAQAKVVRDGPPDGSESNADINNIPAQTSLWPPGGLPECGEPTARKSSKRGPGEPPQLCPRGRDSELTSWGGPGGSFRRARRAVGRLGQARADASPVASGVPTARPALSTRVRADRTSHQPPSLDLVSHLETT